MYKMISIILGLFEYPNFFITIKISGERIKSDKINKRKPMDEEKMAKRSEVFSGCFNLKKIKPKEINTIKNMLKLEEKFLI